jgi:hypothetical protein
LDAQLAAIQGDKFPRLAHAFLLLVERAAEMPLDLGYGLGVRDLL